MSDSSPRIGFIGLGRMGLPMTRNLLSAGFGVTVLSRGRGPVEAALAAGATEANNVADLATSSDIVITALPHPDVSREMFLGAAGLVANAPPGTVLIDVSTVGPELSRETYAAAKDQGLHFLDAPVSGGPEGARDATLTIMAGGDATAFERALPVLRTVGSNVHHIGPSGSGTVMKLVNQLLTAVNGVAAAEAVALGLRGGLQPDGMIDVIGTSFGDSRMFRRVLPLIAARNFDAGAVLDLYLKDLGIIANVAREMQLSTPLAGLVAELMEREREQGRGGMDIAGMVLGVEG